MTTILGCGGLLISEIRRASLSGSQLL